MILFVALSLVSAPHPYMVMPADTSASVPAAAAPVHLDEGRVEVPAPSANLSTPWPSTLEKLWKYSHPPLGERIEFCNDYHPWR